jgi:ubiquinone/menaquinone biosynthesis C-methylase UbiE
MNTPINLSHTPIGSAATGNCSHRGWRAQFACPTGKMGWIASQLMAIQNAKMNQFAIEMLNADPEDRILEIGFGHGKTIRQIAGSTVRGLVAGIDISEVMVSQAARRNRDLINAGLVEISQGSVAAIPYESMRFDKVLAVNNYEFWPEPEHNLEEVCRVLRRDGLLVLCLRMKNPDRRPKRAPGFTDEEIEGIAGLVRWVGFRNLRTKQRGDATCVLANR